MINQLPSIAQKKFPNPTKHVAWLLKDFQGLPSLSSTFKALLSRTSGTLYHIFFDFILTVASLAGGPPRVTPSRGWYPNEIKFFAIEIEKKTLDKQRTKVGMVRRWQVKK